VHALAIREDIYPRTTDRLREQANERALAAAKGRQELRRRAREIATREPALAHELRIGRPDLARTFDDGGLIDVNHAPPPTLALLPGLTGEVLERVVEVRAKQGGFVSAEELGVDADLPPDLVAKIAEYAIFLP
jgi:DNA uptake protein ComE-like DNA-binding protein